jgi:guanyl-specific ribonuclease Sa
MASCIGTKINNRDIAFYVDSKSTKSLPRNGTLTALYASESKTVSLTEDSNGYFDVDYKSVGKFDGSFLSTLSVITISSIVGDNRDKSGIVFSINNGISLANKSSSITTFTTTAATTSCLSTVDIPNNTNASSITTFTTTAATTSCLSTVDIPNNTNASSITTFTTTAATTMSDGIWNSIGNYEVEISLHIKGKSVLVINRNQYFESTANIPTENDKTAVSIVYRNAIGTITPISAYVDGELYTSVATKTSGNLGFPGTNISLFNDENSSYLQGEVRTVLIHGKELTSDELMLIPNLKGD